MVIELAGPPGAGKSTVSPLVAQLVRDHGGSPRMAPEIARLLASRGLLGAAVGILPAGLRRRALWAVYLLEVTVAGWWLVMRRPALTSALWHQRSRPAEAMVAERAVVRWFIRHAGTERMFRRRAQAGEVLIVDEGYVHRSIQLFASIGGRAEPGQLRRYLRAVPPAALTVVVDAPTAQCVERIRGRGVWERLSHRSEDEFEAFVDNAAATVATAATIARELGRHVVSVPNSGSVDVMGASLRAALSGRLPTARVRFRPAWSPPRPGTLQHAAGRFLVPPPLEVEAVVPVLQHLGLVLEGRVRGFSTGRRSAIVRVDTDDGRLVMKRYPHHWSMESIRHEHAVLERLADTGFPSVRLVRGPDGATAIALEGETYAVFRFVVGRTYGGRYLSERQTKILYGDLGELLARLHDELSGFDPGHSHHLGLGPVSGAPRRDLDWHLGRLGDIGATSRPAAGEWFASHASAVGARLTELDARLADPLLSTTVIHGDYGPHNVLYTPDGPVLHDFELARTEWRLTEIAMIATRLRDATKRRALTSAYRRASALDDDEWAMLGEVAEWYLLTSAVYAWDRYLVTSDASRLDLARTRVEKAMELRSIGVDAWI